MERYSSLPDDAAEKDVQQLRSEPRDSMFLMAVIRRIGGADVTVKIRNLSTGGMMAECPISFSRDEMIEADLRGIGTIGGRIAWTVGGRIGVAFDHPVDPRLARRPVSGGPQPQLVQASRSMWRPGLR